MDDVNIKSLRSFKRLNLNGELCKYIIYIINDDVVWILKKMLIFKKTLSEKQIRKMNLDLLREFKDKYYIQESYMIRKQSLDTIFAIVNGIDGVFQFKQM
jgi:hypothetical protein